MCRCYRLFSLANSDPIDRLQCRWMGPTIPMERLVRFQSPTLDLSEELNYFRESFSVRSALVFVFDSVLCLDGFVLSDNRSAQFRSSRTFGSLYFRIARTARILLSWFGSTCIVVSVILELLYIQHIYRIWTLARFFSILSSEETLPTAASVSNRTLTLEFNIERLL